MNETFVRRFLAGEEPLGTRLRVEPAALGLAGKEPLLVEIVGVSQNGRSASPPPNDATPQLFLSYLQCGFRGYYVCLASDVPPESLAASARRAVRDIDKDLPVAGVQTLAAIRSRAFSIPRVLTGVMLSFGLLALGLAVMGTYGLVAHSTALRSREMGIRLALGATTGRSVVAGAQAGHASGCLGPAARAGRRPGDFAAVAGASVRSAHVERREHSRRLPVAARGRLPGLLFPRPPGGEDRSDGGAEI